MSSLNTKPELSVLSLIIVISSFTVENKKSSNISLGIGLNRFVCFTMLSFFSFFKWFLMETHCSQSANIELCNVLKMLIN